VTDERGFTVPEMLVTMVLMAIVMGAFGQMLITSSKTSNRVEEQAALQADVRAAIERLTSDFREATTVGAGGAVESISGTSFTFDSPDRATPFRLRRISYRLAGGELDRSTTTSTNAGSAPWTWPATAGAWIPQLSSVTNAAPFTFYDSGGTSTTNPALVASMRITLTVAPKQNQGGSSTYAALIAIRTLQ
jgi:prepilin-type N-terminal cleavage/methylation domain-containing protein